MKKMLIILILVGGLLYPTNVTAESAEMEEVTQIEVIENM